ALADPHVPVESVYANPRYVGSPFVPGSAPLCATKYAQSFAGMSIHPKICQRLPFVGLFTSTPFTLNLLLLQTCKVIVPAGKSSAKAERGASISIDAASNKSRNRFMSRSRVRRGICDENARY